MPPLGRQVLEQKKKGGRGSEQGLEVGRQKLRKMEEESGETEWEEQS